MTKLIEGSVEHGTVLAFNRYKEMLEAKGFKPVNHTQDEIGGDPTHPEHLLWMCIECPKHITLLGHGFSVDKFSRWLGYVQGCMISRKFTTVEAERNITRPWFTGKE